MTKAKKKIPQTAGAYGVSEKQLARARMVFQLLQEVGVTVGARRADGAVTTQDEVVALAAQLLSYVVADDEELSKAHLRRKIEIALNSEGRTLDPARH
jgi:hypothetical protein